MPQHPRYNADPMSNPQQTTGELTGHDAKIAIIVSRFNEFITEKLLDAAVDKWERLGGLPEALHVVRVPGSFELPVTARRLAESGDYQSVICLGCVIRGETDHYDHVVEQTAKGIKDVGVMTGVPCIFGVITCENLEQAINRAGGKMGNAGGNAMLAGLEMANLMKKL